MSKSEKISLIMQGAGIVTIAVIYTLGCRRIDKIYDYFSRKIASIFGQQQDCN